YFSKAPDQRGTDSFSTTSTMLDQNVLFSSPEEDSSLYFTYSGGRNEVEVRNLNYEVDMAAQIPWYERLSELKMPWEMHSNKQTVIKDRNLCVHSGQMLAVIGSSGSLFLVLGCGKTSLLDIITCRDVRDDIFQLFDLVVLLSSGSAVYCGQAKDMVHYFTSLGYPCPRYCNPSDYYVDLISIDRRSPEKEAQCLEKARMLADQFVEGEEHRGFHVEIRRLRFSGTGCPSKKDRLPGKLQQFTILIKRQVFNDYRDLVMLVVHGLEALLMSLLIGFLYFGAGDEGLSIQDTVALLYMIGALTPFAVVLDVIAKCHSERAMLYHELEDGMYSVTSYFFAKVLGELPDRCMALFVAAVLPTLQTSSFMGNALFTVFYLTAGFVISLFLKLTLIWFSYISFMRWGFEGMLQVQFRGTRIPITIGNLTVEFDGIKVVEMMKMNQYPLYSCYLVLITVAFVFILLYYLSLKFIKQKSSQDW
uniref:ATP-binding cassette, sub-family G (WHITE), member 8 n=1 Tax=Sinocyclocheilus rhinocerous TaxID=307959 RepID=A0A673JIK8_9TELE